MDGRRGDDDLQANGMIVDAGAPGFTERPWQNPLAPCDTDNNGRVEALDVLLLINDINANQARSLPLVPHGAGQLPPYLDVSGDNSIEAVDVLLVINHINSHPRGSGEGEAVAPIASWPNLGWQTASDVPRAVPPAIAGTEQRGQAPNSVYPRSPAFKTIAGDPLLGRVPQTLVPDDLDDPLAGLEAILPDIAEDVFQANQCVFSVIEPG